MLGITKFDALGGHQTEDSPALETGVVLLRLLAGVVGLLGLVGRGYDD